MTKFTDLGYDENTRFLEKTPRYFPADTILKIALDDGSDMPQFSDIREEDRVWFCLNTLVKTEHTPFSILGYDWGTVFKVIVATDVFGAGELVKLHCDNGTYKPSFKSLSVVCRCGSMDFESQLEVYKGPSVQDSTELPDYTNVPQTVPNKYNREIKSSVEASATLTVDVYSVLEAFEVDNSAIAHAVKKLLAPGKRGVKSAEQDIREAISSLERALSM